VRHNRRLYQQSFDAVLARLDGALNVSRPDAGFYLWAETPVADTEFAHGLYKTQNVKVLPGSYLSREVDDINPGSGRIRMALVAPLDECLDAASRIKEYVATI